MKMTFETVLEVFEDYLREDSDCEVVQTRHGYTVLVWDSGMENWDTSECCAMPEELCDELCNALFNFSVLKLTAGERELTGSENDKLQAELDKRRERCLG